MGIEGTEGDSCLAACEALLYGPAITAMPSLSKATETCRWAASLPTAPAPHILWEDPQVLVDGCVHDLLPAQQPQQNSGMADASSTAASRHGALPAVHRSPAACHRRMPRQNFRLSPRVKVGDDASLHRVGQSAACCVCQGCMADGVVQIGKGVCRACCLAAATQAAGAAARAVVGHHCGLHKARGLVAW